ncbi:hypothetical protein BLA18112_01423 [Burkholderia lata]|uniref:Uncharacterized protein n=1 Tax=Burkholderia lata (strain ATCC 17760 / DSM 23089 / LMG 22485 / NCIMB 9086 / R18194 / 383) TaxID=482957 RepID=A0A6P2TNZ6_BURL3|nr:hypothetical protein BLA18112_01423 [Burkholderia lata]
MALALMGGHVGSPLAFDFYSLSQVSPSFGEPPPAPTGAQAGETVPLRPKLACDYAPVDDEASGTVTDVPAGSSVRPVPGVGRSVASLSLDSTTSPSRWPASSL